MINKILGCLLAIVLGISDVPAALFSDCIFDEQEDLYKGEVEQCGHVTMIHLVFTNGAMSELVNASCDLLINSEHKTLKIRSCTGDCRTEKRLSMIIRWIKEKYAEVEAYRWVHDESE